MRNALLSVYDKTGIVEFAQGLIELGWHIISSGGTAKIIREAGLPVRDVAELVGGEAILGHRVVTLSREVGASLLATESDADVEELARLGIPRIDLVCVDMYPLEAEIAREGSTPESVIEKTDIGGPTMLREAVKGRRIVLCEAIDRTRVIQWLRDGSPNKEQFVGELCAKAEFAVANYVLASAEYHGNGEYTGMVGKRVFTCKYGENGWQMPAHLYSTGSPDPLALDKFEVVEGTPPSYNNICDIDRLLQTTTHIVRVNEVNHVTKKMVAVGVKHGNACGGSVSKNPREALGKMMAGDPQAIFGGLIMTNFEIDEVLAETLAGKKLDGVIAPSITEGAITMLRRKGDKCRFIVNPALAALSNSLDQHPRFRYVRGDFLVQPNYTFIPDFSGSECLTKHSLATTDQEDDMMLAWAVGSTSNSNTITLVREGQLIGNGVGQQDRVGAAHLAITRARRAEHDVSGAVAYSDSFFPFPDGPQVLVDAGVRAIFTSSGSVKDKETIDLCRNNNVALYMVPDQVGRGFYGH